MGGNQSTQLNKTLITNITDASTKVMSENMSYTTTSTNALQDANISITGTKIKNCSISTIQTINSNVKVAVKIDSNKQNTIQKEIENKIKAVTQQAVEQKTTGIPVGDNKSHIEDVFDNYNYSDLSTLITSKIVQNVNTDISAQQTSGIKIINSEIDCSNGGDISIKQNIDIQAAVDNAMSDTQVNDLISKLTNDIDHETSQSTKQVNEGLSLMGILLAILLPFIIIGAIFLIGPAAFFGAIWSVITWPFRKIAGLFKKKKKGLTTSFGKRSKKYRLKYL